MFAAGIFLHGLAVIAAAALAVWLLSVYLRNVSIVDILWAPMFLLCAATYVAGGGVPTARAWLVLALAGIWAVRLSAYIAWRNRGQPEDARYRAIRERNEPNFALKSLYLVFGLQVLLAWVISLPLLGAITGRTPLGPFDHVGAALWLVGIIFEAGGDAQLARFKSNPENRGKVMDRGLWRLTRHPNYFGDFCIWWGFYAIALGAGAWWSLISPVLMSVLLMRVSGVTLLEKDIGQRRPQYADYIRRTNAFFPWVPKR